MTVVPPNNLPCLKSHYVAAKIFGNCMHLLPLHCSPWCKHAMQTMAHSAGSIHMLPRHESYPCEQYSYHWTGMISEDEHCPIYSQVCNLINCQNKKLDEQHLLISTLIGTLTLTVSSWRRQCKPELTLLEACMHPYDSNPWEQHSFKRSHSVSSLHIRVMQPGITLWWKHTCSLYVHLASTHSMGMKGTDSADSYSTLVAGSLC